MRINMSILNQNLIGIAFSTTNMKPRPLWELLNKSLAAEEQRKQIEKSDSEWKDLKLGPPSDISSYLPRIYIIFTHLTQLHLIQQPSFFCFLTYLSMWLFTSLISPYQQPLNISAIDILLVLLATCFVVPILPFVFSQIEVIEYFTVPAMIVYVVFGGEEQMRDQLISLPEMGMIAVIMLESTKIQDYEWAILYVNLSFGIFIWKPWKLAQLRMEKSKGNLIIIGITTIFLANLSIGLSTGFILSVSLAWIVNFSVNYLQNYQMKYARKWELPQVNSYS